MGSIIMDAEIQHHELSMDATHTHLTAARRAKLLCFTTTLLLKSHGLQDQTVISCMNPPPQKV